MKELTEREQRFERVWRKVAKGSGGRNAVALEMGISLANVGRIKAIVQRKLGARLPTMGESSLRVRMGDLPEPMAEAEFGITGRDLATASDDELAEVRKRASIELNKRKRAAVRGGVA